MFMRMVNKSKIVITFKVKRKMIPEEHTKAEPAVAGNGEQG